MQSAGSSGRLAARVARAGALVLAFLVIAPVRAAETAPSVESVRSNTAVDRRSWVHDPSTIVKCQETYWLFATGPGIPSQRSRDLIHWSAGPRVFLNPPAWTTNAVPGFRGYFWAPDVIRHSNQFLLYYSVSQWGKNKSAIGLATNPTLDPEASDFHWTDRGPVIQSDNQDDFNAIDPCVTHDEGLNLWLSFGSFWSGIKLLELDPTTGFGQSPASPLHALAFHPSIEAPCIFYHTGFYYLFVNWGQCCRGTNSTYNIRVGRSAQITGPYLDKAGVPMQEDAGTMFMETSGSVIGPGHAGVLSDAGTNWLSYHYYDANRRGAATLGIRRLEWGADGWPVPGQALALAAPSGTPAPARTGTLALEAPVPFVVAQRQSRTQGFVRIAGNAKVSAGRVLYRALGPPALDASYSQWHEIGLDPKTGQFSTNAPLPAGGWYTLEVRVTNQGETVDQRTVDHVGVGEVFIVAGQSNSSNHGSERQNPHSGMVSTFDGTRWKPANDPQPGGSGDGGSFMPAFGDGLFERFGVPIGILAAGVGATSVRQWLPRGELMTNRPTIDAYVTAARPGQWASSGELFDGLMRRMDSVGAHGFRAILWHQGESDAGQARAGYPKECQISGDQYRGFMEKLIRASRAHAGWQVPWFVALATYHSEQDVADEEFRSAQKALWASGLALEGPDSDALGADYRSGVHFNRKGLQAHGRLWAEKVGDWLKADL